MSCLSFEASQHSGEITGLAFSQDANLLIVSVNGGKALSVFSTTGGGLVKKLGRSYHYDVIVNSISCSTRYLAMCSNKGTLHLYKMEGLSMEESTADGNTIEMHSKTNN